MQNEKRGAAEGTLLKSLAWLAIAGVIVLLIPLLLIAVYNHPSADDYSYGAAVVRTWRETGSFLPAIKTAAEEVIGIYNGWQGSFAAVFLMGLQPAVFSESLYALVPFLMLLTYAGATLYFLKVLLIGYLQADRWTYWLISCVVLGLGLLLAPSPVQAFYWYNGAIYYTFFYGLSLALFATLLLLVKTQRKSVAVAYTVLCVLLAAAVGGGNYTSALLAVLLCAFLLLFLIWKKRKKGWLVLLILVVLLAALLVSIVAPGNAVRQASSPQIYGPVTAVLRSLLEAMRMIERWTTLPVLAALLFLLPWVFRMAARSGLAFRYPLLAMGLSFCVFAAGFTPPIYALGSVGPPRLLNIQYFAYLLLLLFNLTYLSGWVASKWKASLAGEPEGASYAKRTVQLCTRYAPVYAVVLLLLLAGSLLASPDVRKMGPVNAAISLQNGEARAYHEEVLARNALLYDPTLQDVQLPAFQNKPYVLFYEDITETMDDWKNVAAARYFEKDSIVLQAAP